MLDRIRNTCILCYGLICEIKLAVFIDCNVLKKSVSLDCVVDIRLGLLVKVDDLR